MAGYDDDTSETVTIPLVVKPDYWVELKTCLERRDLAETEKALTRMSASLSGEATLTPDVPAYREIMVFRSIVDWNLTEKDGTPRPVTLANVQKLKGPDFDAILAKVTEMNSAKTQQEQSKIPD
jgi:hypothetical protein